MERIPGVAAATHQTWFGGYYQDRKYFFMQSPVVPEEFLDMHPELILPPEQKQAWLRTRTGAIVGRKTAERFHWKLGDRVPIQTPIWTKGDGSQTWDFEIVGIFDGKEKSDDTMSLFFHYDYFDEARRGAKGQVGWFTVRVKDPAQAAAVAKLVDQEFENSAEETKTEPEGAFLQAWVKQIGNIALMTAAILGAVFFTILLVTGNTMSQAVRERTGELGVLKAIGFTNGRILALVLARVLRAGGLGRRAGFGSGLAHRAGAGQAALGDVADVLLSRPRPAGGVWNLFGIGSGDRLFPCVAGDAFARGRCLEENVIWRVRSTGCRKWPR